MIEYIPSGRCEAKWEFLGVPEYLPNDRLEVYYTLTIEKYRMISTRQETEMWLMRSNLFEYVGSRRTPYRAEPNLPLKSFVTFFVIKYPEV